MFCITILTAISGSWEVPVIRKEIVIILLLFSCENNRQDLILSGLSKKEESGLSVSLPSFLGSKPLVANPKMNEAGPMG